MGALIFKNNATTTLSGSINDTQTTITVTSASLFPVLTGSDFFYLTMYEVASSVETNIEIVKVTATTGANWTVVRGQDGTTARARSGVITCYIELRMNAASAQLMLQSTNNLADLTSASSARTNLGLDTMATQSAANVAITGGSISGVSIIGIDSTTSIADNADTTKKVTFEVSGVTTGTTRTMTVPNASGTLALTSDLAAYQPLDTDLTAIAALAAFGLLARTATGTMAVRTIAVPASGMSITNPDGVSGNPTIALANDLSAVEALSTTGFVRRTATDTWSASAIIDADLPSALTGKSYNALSLTAAAIGFTVAGGTASKTLTVSNTLTLAGTDSSTLNIGAGGTLGSAAYTASTAYAPTAGSSSITTLGTVATGTWNASVIGLSYGGTGATTKAAAFNALSPVTTLGDLIYGDATNSNARLAGNITTTKKFLTQTGNATTSLAPSWDTIIDADLPSALTGKSYNALSLTSLAAGFTVAGGTASKTLTVSNTLTFSGTDGTSFSLPATSGSIPLSNQTFFIGTTSVAINRASASLSLTGVNIDGSAGSAVSATTATKATNLVGGNATTLLGSIAYQSAADTTSLLSPNVTTTKTFLSQTGTGTNGAAPSWTSLAKVDVGLGNVENTALSTWAGSANIVTVGTITSGVWTGSAIGLSSGGTGATSKTAAFNALSPMSTLGDTEYHDGTNGVRLAGNITTTKKFLTQTGNGTASTAPGWNAIVDGDLPTALTSKTYNALTLTANAVGFQVAGGTTSKTLAVSNNLTLAGTDGSTLNVGAGGTLGSAAFTASTAYQVADADLTAIAALTGTSGFLKTNGAGTWSVDTSTYLTTASASSTYLTTATAASTYLTPATAASTYLTPATAASTYLTPATADATYLKPATAASTYLASATAASTYLTISSASSTYLTSAFPSGTKVVFAQTAAPTGWTKVVTYDNAALRVVSGAASSGGTVNFTAAFASQNVGDTTLSQAQMPAHNHPAYDSGHSHGAGDYGHNHTIGYMFGGGPQFQGGGDYFWGEATAGIGFGNIYVTGGNASVGTTNTGGGGSHTHSLNMAVKYVDTIIASKD